MQMCVAKDDQWTTLMQLLLMIVLLNFLLRLTILP